MALQKTISPIDGSVYVERPLAEGDAIEAALVRAVAAQRSWRNVPLAERIAIVGRFVAEMERHAPEFGQQLAWQMGRPIRYGSFEITRGFAERARYMMEVATDALADIIPTPKEGFARSIRREPVGVVFIVAPWNYPYLTAVNALVPALLAGNAVVLKHSAQTPLCAEQFASCLAAAGLPDGVYQHLHLSHSDVAKVIGDPRVGFVSFTGSVSGGHAVQRAASEKFMGTGLELGGKDPAYVCADADLAHAVENLVDGAMFNSGQSCCGIERIYVHQSLYSRFVADAVELTRQYKLGNPLDKETTLGPMVRASAADFVRGQIAEAVAQGATTHLQWPDEAGSPYLGPQIVTGVHHQMRIMREETFGPAVGIMPVASDEEAVALMNDSDLGLTAAIWTSDADAAAAIGSQLETGTVFMNRCDYLDPALAWTGVKDTGRGCTLSVLGFEAFTRPKSFHFRLETKG